MSQEHQRSRREQIAIFRRIFKEAGMKMTPQRLEIFLEVSSSRNHPSAEDIFNAVVERLPTISLDTVYRALSAYEQSGLITRVNLERGRARFDPNTNHHHHAVCLECKSIVDFQLPELDNVAIPRSLCKWGSISFKNIQIGGICPKCLENKRVQNDEAHSVGSRRLAACP